MTMPSANASWRPRLYVRIASETAGVGVYSSPCASMTATLLAASTSSALASAGTERACVSMPRNGEPSIRCFFRYGQMACMMARMCFSLKALSNAQPRCPEVPKATRCRPGLLQGLVVERLGAGSRVATARNGVATVAAGCGYPDVALRFTRELAPRAVMGLLAVCEALEVRHELVTLPRQSRERLDMPWVHQLGLVTERVPVVHAGANQLPKNVGGRHGDRRAATTEPRRVIPRFGRRGSPDAQSAHWDANFASQGGGSLSDEGHARPRSDQVVRGPECKLGTRLGDIQWTLEGCVDGALPGASVARLLLHGEPQRLPVRADHHVDVHVLLRFPVEVVGTLRDSKRRSGDPATPYQRTSSRQKRPRASVGCARRNAIIDLKKRW